MERIDSMNVAENLHGVGKHGFHGGNPQTGEKSTYFTPKWCNGLQEEVVRVIEAAGITPSSESYEQLLAAIKHFSWGEGKTAAPWVATGGSLNNDNLTDGTRAGIGADLGISNAYEGNLDSLTTSGEYYFKASSQADALTKSAPSINAVGVQHGLVKVWRETADIVYQIFHGANNELFIRYRSPGLVWTFWRHMMGSNNSVSIAGMYGAQSIGGGMIEQWGSAITDAAGYININFPVAFPNECYGVHAMHVGGDVVSFCEMGGTLTTTGVRLRTRDSQLAVGTWLVRWRAIGH